MRDLSVCSFCNEFNGEDTNNFFIKYLKDTFKKVGLHSRVVGETNCFVVMPMVGPLVPGYLLVLPKRHVESFSLLNDVELAEASDIVKSIREIFRKKYGEIVIYEHGAFSATLRGGCCSDHAHTHIVAVDEDVSPELKNIFEARSLNGIKDLVEQRKQNSPYLYYENQCGHSFVMNVDIIESQYIRKLIAKKIGALDRIYWDENVQYDWMIDVIRYCRPFIEELKGKGLWQ
jgi:diadenosine tetraphosphate (Ap4A) HIT family hydrolase